MHCRKVALPMQCDLGDIYTNIWAYTYLQQELSYRKQIARQLHKH